MSSDEYETDEQSEPAETARTATYESQDEEQSTFVTTSTKTVEQTATTTEVLETDDEIEEICMDPKEVTFSYSPFDMVLAIYNNYYYWAIFKSTVLFIIALKMARESKMMLIPLRDYIPFQRN